MSAFIPIKINFNNTLRRLSIPSSTSLGELWRLIGKLYGPVVSYHSHSILYADDEDERVAVRYFRRLIPITTN